MLKEHPLLVFSGRANEPLAEAICDYLQMPMGKLKLGNFSDGEIYCQIQDNVRGADVFIVQPTGRPANESLMELLIAMLLTAVLLLGLVQFATAAGASRRLQDSQSRLQDQARTAVRLLGDAVGEAGFDPAPWSGEYALDDAFAGSADDISSLSDRLVVRGWSDRNCFDNRNPDLDPEGEPLFYIRESMFDTVVIVIIIVIVVVIVIAGIPHSITIQVGGVYRRCPIS